MLQVKYRKSRNILKTDYCKYINQQSFSASVANKNGKEIYKAMAELISDKYLPITKITAKELFDTFKKHNRFAFHKIFKGIDFNILLSSEFEELENIVNKINENKKKLCFYEKKYVVNSNIAIDYIFNYQNKFQNHISKFFENNVELYTCHYCNIDHVNVFGAKFSDYFDFLNYGTEEELKSIKNIGKTTITKIFNFRKFNKFSDDNDVKKVFGKGKRFNRIKIIDLTSVNQKNAFTLDHVIDKGKYPYLALSLFNLVPSCSTCNSKLKKERSISSKSPTSISFSFHDDIKFKGFLNRNSYVKDLLKADLSKIDFRLDLTNPEYKEYIKVFRLNERYFFYKSKGVDLIEKRRKYPDSYIKDISEKIGYKEEEIKNDLFDGFPHHKDELHKKSFSKFKTDIAEQLGLK